MLRVRFYASVLLLRFLSIFRKFTISVGFSKITHFLERILMEHKELICSLEPKLTLVSICSIGILTWKWDIFKNRSSLIPTHLYAKTQGKNHFQ